MEAEHPVRIEDYSFVTDSCGAGQYRGGVGIRRSYRILAPEALLQLRTDRVKFHPYGLDGGEPGGLSRNYLEIDNERSAIPGKITRNVSGGALLIHEQAGAGGFGNPLLRDPADVREDFLDGKITAEFARKHYAVAFGPRGVLDAAATAALRAERGTPERRHGA
jgi:N-methylhydantoinase B